MSIAEPTAPGQGPETTDLLVAAHQLHSRNISVIPVRANKEAATRWKRYREQFATRKTLMSWFGNGRADVSAVGIVCGRISGGGLVLAVRDFDDPDAYVRWRDEHPDLAGRLPTVKTPNGYHVYHLVERELFINCGDGEYRASGGQYVIAPPSVTVDGTYRWLIPLPEFPWVIPLVDDPAGAGLIPVIHRESANGAMIHRRPYETLGDSRGGSKGDSTEIGVNAINRIDDPVDLLSAADVQIRIQQAITDTLPAEFGQRHHKVFELARHIQGIHPAFDKARCSADIMLPAVRQWHQRALPKIRTTDWEETWLDFIDGWEKVRVPRGQSIMEAVMKRVTTDGIPERIRKYQIEALDRLCAICRELQRNAGDAPFPLSARKAAELLGVPNESGGAWWQRGSAQANRYLRLLVREGVLVLVERATVEDFGKRASFYNYVENT